MSRILSLLALIFTLTLMLAAGPTIAQDDCPALVEQALTEAGVCAGLETNQACLGSPVVDAEIMANLGVTFESSGDTVALGALQSLVSRPLDAEAGTWGVAVLKPELDGQLATFLMLGGVSVKSLAEPEAGAPEITPVEATTVSTNNVNLRDLPTTSNSTVVDTLAPSTPVELIGINATGDWYQLDRNGTTPWVWGQLIAIDDPAAAAELPVTEPGAVTAPSGPGLAQAFTFNTPSGAPACDEAAHGLVVQSDSLEPVGFKIGEGEIMLAGTAVFMHTGDTKPDEGMGTSLLLIFLAEGQLNTTVGGMEVVLNEPGQTLGITLDVTGGDGMIGPDARLATPEMGAPDPAPVCRNATGSGLLPREFGADSCDAEIVYIYTVTATNDVDYPVVLWVDGETAVPFDAMETKSFPIPGGPHDFQVCNENAEAGDSDACGEMNAFNTGRIIDQDQTWEGWLPQ